MNTNKNLKSSQEEKNFASYFNNVQKAAKKEIRVCEECLEVYEDWENVDAIKNYQICLKCISQIDHDCKLKSDGWCICENNDLRWNL